MTDHHVDFSALLSRNHRHRPARVARIVPREALRPVAPHRTVGTDGPSAGAAGGTAARDKPKEGGIAAGCAGVAGPAAEGAVNKTRSVAGDLKSNISTSNVAGSKTRGVVCALDEGTGKARVVGFDGVDDDAVFERAGSNSVYVIEVTMTEGEVETMKEALSGNDEGADAMQMDTASQVVSADSSAEEEAGGERGTNAAVAMTSGCGVRSGIVAEEDGDAEEVIEADEDGVFNVEWDAETRWFRRERRRQEADARIVLALGARARKAEKLASELAARTREYGIHAAEDDDEEYEDEGDSAVKVAKGRGLPLDLDEEDGEAQLLRRIALEQRRLRIEMSLPPELHEVELGDWESGIDWEGVPTGAGNNDSGGTKKGMRPREEENDPASSSSGAAMALLSEPRNPFLDALDLLDPRLVSWLGADAPPGHNRTLARSVPLLLEAGEAGRSVALRSLPPCRPLPFGQTEIFDDRIEREVSSATSSTAMSLGNALNPDNEKLEKIIEARQKRRAEMAKEKSNRVTEAMEKLALGGGQGRTITSSLMGPGGTERTGRPSRHGGSGGDYDTEYVEQLDMVYSHTLVKPDLAKSELRQFHRPRLPLNAVRKGRQWQFQVRITPARLAELVKKMSRKGGAGGTYSRTGAGAVGTVGADGSIVGSYNAHASGTSGQKIRTEADLSPSEGDLVLLEYSEERPPFQLSKGIGSKIVNYYRGDKARCPVSAGGGDRPTRKRQHGDKAGGADGATGPGQGGQETGKAEKPPRMKGPDRADKVSAHDLIGDFRRKKPGADGGAGGAGGEKSEKEKKPKVQVLPEGVTEILHPKAHGPFIGEVEEGTTQTGLITNLFSAPMFRHDPEPTDFLMVLGRKPNKHGSHHGGGGGLGVVLRPLPANLFCVGQTEPRVKVFAPNTTLEKSFTAPFVTFQIAKALARTQNKEGHGLRFDEISERLFANTAILPNALRQRIKQVASYDKNTQIWTLKPVGFEDFPGVDGLGRRFSAEGVATYEAACAAVRRLCDLGIQELSSGSGSVVSLGAAMVYLTGSMNSARERKSKMSKMAEYAKTSRSKTKSRQVAMYERAASKLEVAWKDLRRKHDMAKFIFEELQLTPWHLTSEFIDVHKQAQGTGMMKLTGLGDPSGLGEAYNFLREVDAKPNKGTGNSDGALSAQIKKITGTENDLRKLTMKQMASLLRSYGMGQKEIETLKRWDRVHVIRDLSTKAASDGMGDGLERYARGEKMKLRDQKEMYRERIQEIWRRQRNSLSTDAGNLEIVRAPEKTTADEGGEAEKSSALDKQLEKDMRDSDSDSDDEDFEATFEEDFMDLKMTNQLVSAQTGGDGGPTRSQATRDNESGELSQEDARELAALKRQREEERQAQEGLLGKSGAGPNSLESKKSGAIARAQNNKGRKVIRRRVTKRHPDGTQTTTFKFVTQPAEVEKIISGNRKKREKGSSDGKKKKGHRKDRRHAGVEDDEKRAVGHAMFEDEDNDDHHRSGMKIKLQVQRRTRVITTKTKKGKERRTGDGMDEYQRAPSGLGGKKSKSSSSKSKDKALAERRMKKRRRELEEADLYMTAPQRKGTSNRRERGAARDRMPHVIMADRLEGIRSEVEKRTGSAPFHRPVNRRLIPRYYEVISEPIDLQTIRDKNQR